MKHGITHNRSQKLVEHAFDFANDVHRDQKRKYTNDPYIVHPVSVAHMVASRTSDVEMICAALLHDVIEDTPAEPHDLMAAGFWRSITQLVVELTDVSELSDGNRATRKAIDRAHTAAASPRAKTVKLADLLDNSYSIIRYDPGFAKVFMREVELLLPMLEEGDAVLWGMVNDRLKQYRRST